jgi:hypothetical protein
MALTIYVNTGTSDVALTDSSGEFTEIDVDADSLIFSNGSNTVADGEPIPSESALNSAGILLDGTEQIVPHYFLADNSAGILKEIFNAGNQNKRYTFAFDWDDVSGVASEPVLEIWDDDDLDSIDNISLGAGTASSSWWRGVVTTGALPGADWVGQRLAGSSASNYLLLNDGDGPITGPDTLYCNLKVIAPASQISAGSNECIIAIKYSST